jgi:P-type Cu+ transporter
MTVTDPVCGMKIEAKAARASLHYGGRDYHFCSVGCWVEFERHPEEYAAKDRGEAEGREDV